jgi:hypothetical protein
MAYLSREGEGGKASPWHYDCCRHVFVDDQLKCPLFVRGEIHSIAGWLQ